ncbi:DUF3108 domain-containing protein [Pseudorhodoferax sp.]|uniref:DUF3108 domain-containing protein n=1 Tax=Pseudorhodoferax sp. TaxID=1993553 RepID=UPI0039E49E4F
MQADRMAAGVVQDTGNRRGPALLGLGLAVLLAHLVALQQLPAMLAPPDPARTRAFTTRSILLAPPPPATAPAVAQAPLPPPAAPKRRPRPAPPPTTPAAPAQAPAPPADAPGPAAADPPAADLPAQAPVAAEDAAPEAPQPAASAPAAEAVPAAGAAPAPPPAEPTRAAAEPLAIPGSVRLKYTLTGEARQQTYHAMGELLWLQDGSTYDARLEYSAFLIGSRVRTSSGRITAHGLEPARFSDQWRRRDLVAQFERDQGRVSFSAGTPSVPLLPDAQDQLSVLLQLASRIAGDPARHAAGTSITLPVVGPRDADTWTFTLQGEELLYLPYDHVQALKLTRDPRRASDQKVEAWLAPALGYMPVQVRITQPNGDFVEQQLRSVSTP